jgi:hypothetical protein
MKIKIEIELDTVQDEQELQELLEIFQSIRNKEYEEEDDD